MPRYFFHLAGSGARDIEGQEFADEEGARQEAVVVARELAGGRSISKNARIVVTDAKGKVIQKSRWAADKTLLQRTRLIHTRL